MMNTKRLTVTMIATVISFIVNLGINFFLTPYIVNSVGSEAYGFVSLANNFVSYAEILTVALNSMAGRFITISIVQKKYDEARQYFTSVFFANIILSVALLVPSIIFIFDLDKYINVPLEILSDVKKLFFLIFFSFFVGIVGTSFSVATFAKDRKDIEAKRNIEAHIIKAVVIIVAFAFLQPKVFYIGVASVVMAIYTFSVNVFYTNRLLPEIGVSRRFFDRHKIFTVLKAGWWNSLSKLGIVFSNGLDLIITNLFISTTAMGTLSIAKVLPSVVSVLISSISGIFIPGFTISYAQNDQEQLKKHMRKSMLILGLISNVVICLLFVLGNDFFELWMPKVDAGELRVLSLLTVSYLAVEGVIQCLWSLFTVTNKLRLNSIITVTTSFLNVLIVFVVLKMTDWGIYAVAGISSAISILRTLIFSIPYASKCAQINKRFFYLPIIKCNVALALSVTLSNFICVNLSRSGWMELILCAGLVTIITVIITLCMVIDKGAHAFKYKA